MSFADRYAKHRSKRDPEFKKLWEKRKQYIRKIKEDYIQQGYPEQEADLKTYQQLDQKEK